MRGILPFLGWRHAVVRHVLGLLVLLETRSTATRRGPFPGSRWDIGGVFILDVGAVCWASSSWSSTSGMRPAFFRGEVLNRDTPTRVPQDIGTPVGLFGIDPSSDARRLTPESQRATAVVR